MKYWNNILDAMNYINIIKINFISFYFLKMWLLEKLKCGLHYISNKHCGSIPLLWGPDLIIQLLLWHFSLDVQYFKNKKKFLQKFNYKSPPSKLL